jgi:hypothetical protein
VLIAHDQCGLNAGGHIRMDPFVVAAQGLGEFAGTESGTIQMLILTIMPFYGNLMV